jgi:hypothetical protein
LFLISIVSSGHSARPVFFLHLHLTGARARWRWRRRASTGSVDVETDGDTEKLGLTDDVGVSDKPVVAATDGDTDVEREDAGLADVERDTDAAAEGDTVGDAGVEGDTVGSAKVPPRKMMTPATPLAAATFSWPPDPVAFGSGNGSGPFALTPSALLTKLEPPPPLPAAPL